MCVRYPRRLPESVLLRRQRSGGGREPTLGGRHDVREAVRPDKIPDGLFLLFGGQPVIWRRR
jgi:hypothetical protein